MIKDTSISIIGGDLRFVYLANLLQRDRKVYMYANEHKKILKDIKICNTLEEVIEKSRVIILPIPFSKDKKTIFSPFYKNEIQIKKFLNENISNKTVIGGAFTNEVKNESIDYGFELIDLIDDYEFALYNAIPTAEGVISLMMKNSSITIYGSRCLILGFGRCAIVQAKLLEGLKANVTIAARNSSQLAMADINGYEAIHIKELDRIINDYDFIINTIPSPLLKEEYLNVINHNSLVIDIANQLETKILNNNIKIFNERGIPGKYAPISAGEIIYKILLGKRLIN